MPNINPDTIYAFPETEPVRSGDEISLEELTGLVDAINEQLDELGRAAFAANIERHIGVNATYSLKSEALQGLKLIYDRFMARDTKDSEKAMIALKLQERAEHCTGGFHNGINEILDGFFLAKNLNDLMYRIRQDIVARTATQISDDTHVNNRCFMVAETAGYGVHLLNRGDQHINTMIDEIPNEQIQTALQKAFDKTLRVFSVLDALEATLRGQLSGAGYEGPKEDGYQTDEFYAIETQLMLLFKENPEAQALLQTKTMLDEKMNQYEQYRAEATNAIQIFAEKHPIAFTELNKYKQLKLRALLGEGGLQPFVTKWVDEAQEKLSEADKVIFLKLQADYKKVTGITGEARNRLNVARRAFNARFFLENNAGATDINWAQVRQLLWQGMKAQHYFEGGEEEAYIDTIMDPSISDSERANVCEVLSSLQNNTADLLDTLIHSQLPEALIQEKLTAHLFEIPESEQYQAFQMILSAGIKNEIKQNFCQLYFLAFFTRIKEDIPFLVKMLPFMERDQIVYCLTDNELRKGLIGIGNFEKIIRSLNVEVFRSLMQAVQALPRNVRDEVSRDIFTQTDEKGNNLLMKLAHFKAEGISPLIEAMLRLPDDIRSDTLRSVFTQTNEKGFSALMLAAEVNPAAIRPLMEAIKRFPDDIRNDVLRSVFTQTDKAGYNVCMRLVAFNPGNIESLMDVMLELPESIRSDVLRSLLYTSSNGTNAFRIATEVNPAAIRPLMEAMKRLPDDIRSDILRTVFMQTDTAGYRLFSRLVFFKPENIKFLLDAMLDLPENIKSNIVRTVLTLSYASKQTRGALLAKYYLLSLNELLHAAPSQLGYIKGGVDNVVQFIAWICMAENLKPIMQLARSDLSIFKPLIQNILLLSGSLRSSALKLVLTERDNFGRTPLMLLLRENPEEVIFILESLSTLSDADKYSILTSVLTHTNQFQQNFLMLAVRLQPDAVSGILNEVQKLPEETKISVFKALFTQTDKWGNNALMVAIENRPAALNALKACLSTLPESIKGDVTQTVFQQAERLEKRAATQKLNQLKTELMPSGTQTTQSMRAAVESFRKDEDDEHGQGPVVPPA